MRVRRARIVESAIDREREHDVVLALVRCDAADGKPVGTATITITTAPLEERRVGRGVVVGEVDEDRRDRSAPATEVHHLALVVRGVGQREPHLRRNIGQLPAAFEHARRARLPAPEVLRVGDVVIVERERNVERAHDIEKRAPDREVIQDPGVPIGHRTIWVRGRAESLLADIVMDVERVDVGRETRVAQEPAEPERVHPDRVPTGERREELVDLGHDVDVPSDASAPASSELMRASRASTRSSASIRSAAACPTEAAAQPKACICSAR